MKTLIIFEESSRVGFGGGQKMTLITCEILREKYKFRFVDFTDDSKFVQVVREKYEDCEQVCIGHANTKSRKRYVAWIKAIWQMIVFFKKDVRKIANGIDKEETVSYVTNKRGLMYAYYLNKKYGIPFIYHAHLVENPQGIYYKLFKKWVSKATSILCVSKIVIDSIDLPQCQLLYNPTLNEKGYKGEKMDDHFVVAYVGGLIPIKGVEYYVDAAKICPEAIEFRIYGEGFLQEELEKRSEGRVVFKGFSNDVIGEYYREVDVVVLPTILKEALPLVVADAKSVGLPAVVTSPGGQAEIVRDRVDGFHVGMNNSKEIAEAIMKLTDDKTLYNKMSKAAFESSSIFSYKKYKENILSIFANL